MGAAVKEQAITHLRIRIDAATLEAIKDRAEQNLRSLNAEVLHAIRFVLGRDGEPAPKKPGPRKAT